jgi:excisionase family DNA binding protein
MQDDRDRVTEIVRALDELGTSKRGPAQLNLPERDPLDIPDVLTRVLRDAALALSEGAAAVRVVPEDKELTTSQAAELLGVSRPHLIQILEREDIPYRMVGTHRRIPLQSLSKYFQAQEAASARAFQAMIDLSEEVGLYDQSDSADAAS